MHINKFYKKDILSANQFNRKDIEYIFQVASEMEKIVLKQGHIDILKGKIMTALFYEPSSRTFSSFVTAIQRLGGGFIPIHGISNSSVAKGETLADTARTFAKYADVIVMRHPKKGAARTAAQYSNVPVINAGDGIGEHPSQAMLDIFTIYKRHNKIDGLTVTFVGDMLNGRTVHSLSILLSRFNSITIQFISPKELQPSSKLVQWLRKHGVKVHIFEDLLPVLSKTDVLYVTRVQKERFADLLLYEKLKHKYIITMAEISRMKKSAIILHPFPRVGEVEEAVDSDARAVYIQEQMKNGMYIRMTLLTLVLRKEDISAYFTNDLFVTLSKKSIHTDPIHTYNLFHKAIKKERDYHLVKSLGPETFHAATAQMRLSEFKSMYLNMLFPHLLPESKSTLMISERNIQLKNGELGRTSSHIYLNHRIPLFNDIWDKKLLVKLLELVIHEKILPHGSIYGVVGISSSSSPELTTALHEGSPYSTSRISLLPINILKKEKGTHEPIYGEIDCTMPWIFIDDVFTSGNTFKKSLDQFRKGIPKNTSNIKTYAATLVNRNPSAALDFEEKTNMKVCSLITLDELLKYHWKHFSSLQKKLINSERNL